MRGAPTVLPEAGSGRSGGCRGGGWTRGPLKHGLYRAHRLSGCRRSHRPNGMKSDPTLCLRRTGLDQPELASALDCGIARTDVELAVNRDRMRLHRVARDIHALGDLSKGEVRAEVRDQAQLRLGQG